MDINFDKYQTNNYNIIEKSLYNVYKIIWNKLFSLLKQILDYIIYNKSKGLFVILKFVIFCIIYSLLFAYGHKLKLKTIPLRLVYIIPGICFLIYHYTNVCDKVRLDAVLKGLLFFILHLLIYFALLPLSKFLVVFYSLLISLIIISNIYLCEFDIINFIKNII